MNSHSNYIPDPARDGVKKIVVGMSGGVDSSVAAAILKKMGHEVIGLFMKNWDEPDGPCPAEKDFEDVARVCARLDIPFFPVEFIKEYQDSVFQWFLKEYEAGHTPNPDILCNREIKFKVFYKHALQLGADYFATGHYAQHMIDPDGHHHMLKGADPGKDQSYFLCSMEEEILKRVLFPVGHLQKKEVRKIAEEAQLSVMHKKDSTGICFIGERPFRQFLSTYLKPKPGPFKHLNGEVVGRHQGVHFYTLGQRKGLGLGGPGEAWFVVAKDRASNTVFVERGENHPALFARWLTCTELSWVSTGLKLEGPLSVQAKIRYRQEDQECVITPMPGGQVRVDFAQPQRAITPRQAVVFYQGAKCLGGGFIETVGPSLYTQA